MDIKNAELEVIATRRSQYPENAKPEFLLVGRSNVGKSSFINTILSRKNLAHTSSRPGKTQTLNFYSVNNKFYLIDVPGYGYAQVGKEEQKKFGLMIEEYLQKRENLKRVYLLVDLRHKPSEDDILMYKFLKYYHVPVTIVATKADKIVKSKREKAKDIVLQALQLEIGDNFYIFSSETREGKEAILKEIESLVEETN